MQAIRICLAVPFLLLSVLLSGQINYPAGQIRGTVHDGETGETMPGVAVYAEGTTKGAVTDLDGKFRLSIEPGTYQMKVSYISYETLQISNVVVREGGTTVLDNLKLNETSIKLGEAVVTAEAIKNTETAMLAMKKSSVNVLDGISSAGLKRTGDSDVASSMKRVTGVSVEGGKYVFVRGLGDRYTKTTLNGVDIPGLDPDRNSFQMDIFPTGVVENIIVNKTFSADLPADFTGGVININLKDFPETRQGNFSISAGYNPNAHFNSDYLTYEGGKTDFLGFDDGTRDIPATTNIPFYSEALKGPDGETGLRYREILEAFNPTMAATKQKSFMDFGISASFGNQFETGKHTLGYTASVSYKNSTDFYKNAEYGRYGLTSNPDDTEMERRELREGNYGVKNVLWSALAGFALKTMNAKYRIYLLHIQNGQSAAGIFDYDRSDLGTEFSGFQHNLGYTQRSVSNILIDGKHLWNEAGWEVEWKLSPTYSVIKDPDIRFTRYQERSNGTLAIGTEVGFPERIWRHTDEINLAGVLHFTKKFIFNSRDANLKFGGAYTYKGRSFVIRDFAINPRNIPLTGNPDELFLSDNLWPYQGNTSRGTTYEASFLPVNPNKFESAVHGAAGYISTELGIAKGLKTVVGVRVEKYIQYYTGRNQLGTIILDNDKVLDDLDLFPTVNVIYNFTKAQNLRFAYSKTIARPSFKELSHSQIYDPVTGRTFIGGLSEDADNQSGITYWNGILISSDIHNFDFRWELFQQKGQTISAGLFYKKFKNPIEIVQFSSQDGSFQPRNVGDGEVVGGEVEVRQNLDLLHKSLKNLSLMFNFTYAQSQIKMSKTEYDSRVRNARTGQKIGSRRDMAGQAPLLINAGLAYNANDSGFGKGLDIGLYYNVQGQTLQYVGINDLPDIYSQPFHSLNLNVNKNFGENERFQAGLKIDNLLNDNKETIFKSYNAADRNFEWLSPGTTFELRLGYSFY